MLESLYIADRSNNLIFEYLVSQDSPSFKSLLDYLISNQEITSVDYDSVPLIEISNDHYLCYQKSNNLIIYVIFCTANNPNPMIPYVFINRLIEVMEDYFGVPLAITKIEANNDTLIMLVNEMMDDGVPNMTDCNQLRDIIPFKSLLSKFLKTSNELAAAAGKGSLSSLTQGNKHIESFGDEKSVPWRRSNVKYTNNEMYVDVIETINVMLTPIPKSRTKSSYAVQSFDSAFYSSASSNSMELVPITGEINGRIEFLSHLTGVPLLHLYLKTAGIKIDFPSLHRCINLDTWQQTKNLLSFIPPDGRSTLMEYQIDLDLFNKREKLDMLGLIQVDLQTELGLLKNEFEIKLFTKTNQSVTKFENLCIQIFSKSETDEDEDNEDESSNILNMKASRITHGDFTYKGRGMAEWNLRTLSTGVQPLLHGSITSSTLEEASEMFGSSSSSNLIEGMEDKENVSSKEQSSLKPIYVKLSYSYKGSVPSGIKVDTLKIVSAKGMGDSVKPYKGVKYVTKTGNFIIRS